jgi:hypothetical protein
MNKISVSKRLAITSSGPISSESGELIHLRQGDIDGACGPYCISMALIAAKIITRSDATNLDRLDGRTRAGRFRDALLTFGGLSVDGTNNDDLLWLADFFKSNGLNAREVLGSKKEIFTEIVNVIDSGGLPIIKVLWQGGGRHWLMGVGYQGTERNAQFQPTHLLTLDPGQQNPTCSMWNAVIEVFDKNGGAVHSGRLSSAHWGMDGSETKCQIEGVVVFDF